MEPKFKQIASFKETECIDIRTTEKAVNSALNCLLGNVAQHVYTKAAVQKSKYFLKNKIINIEVDSVKQIYQNRPAIPSHMREQQSPIKAKNQCMRPLSAQVRNTSSTNLRNTLTNNSKKSIDSFRSQISFVRSKKTSTSASSLLQNKKGKKYVKKTSNQKKFFAVKNFNEEDSFHENFIQQLRRRKAEQQNELKKKQQFLRSIQIQTLNQQAAQAKFCKTTNQKKFIYGKSGQIIQISGNSLGNHLKKISAMSRSRVQIKKKQSSQLKKLQNQLKQNIYIQFKGRQNLIKPQRPQTGKIIATQKNLIQQIKNKFQSNKQTKRNFEIDGLKQKQNEQAFGSKQFRVTIQNEGLSKKKPMQKILFYNSPNTIYRVINDAPSAQKTKD